MIFENEIQMSQYIVHMIEEGNLIDAKTVKKYYGFTSEFLQGLVRTGEIPPPSNYLGKEWYLRELMDLLSIHYPETDEPID